MWLLLVCFATTIAFDASISQTQHPGSSSIEVVINMGAHESPVQDMKPIMDHMQRLAQHMDAAFGGQPLDLDSFFRDTMNHFHAMHQALLGQDHALPQVDLHRSLLGHMAHRPQCPKVAVAAACHCLLHQCMHRVLPKVLPGMDAWDLAYGCLMKHRQFATDKCNAVLDKTSQKLGEPSPQPAPAKHEKHELSPQPKAVAAPDEDGCWQKESGRWCPSPHGWALESPKPAPTASPTHESTDPPSYSPTLEAQTTSELDEAADMHNSEPMDSNDEPRAKSWRGVPGRLMTEALTGAQKSFETFQAFSLRALKTRNYPAIAGLLLLAWALCYALFTALQFCCCKKSDSLGHTYTFLLKGGHGESSEGQV